MMGSTRTGAAMAASAAGSRRAGAGTIGEAAAIAARRAAAGETAEAVSAPASVSPPPPDESERHPAAFPGHGAARPDEEPLSAPPAQEPIPLRRTRVGAGQVKDLPQVADRTAVHLILAGRAYAYGQRIVRKEEARKPGDVVAIES